MVVIIQKFARRMFTYLPLLAVKVLLSPLSLYRLLWFNFLFLFSSSSFADEDAGSE